MRATYVFIIALVVGLIGCQSSKMDLMSERQAEVAAKGAEVMPFNLDATTHIFEKTPTGGVQQVVADSNDPEQVSLIREHLQEISTKFASGNFHDPTMIHGPEMAGLHELIMGHDRLEITYSEIDLGGKILYSSEDNKLVAALHSWFDAQLSDHGEHAQSHR